MGYGQTFLDLMLAAAVVIKSNIRIEYTEARPKDRKFAEAIMRLCHIGQVRDDSSHEHQTKRQERRELFLRIFNGNWRSTTITHHCSMYCPCSGASKEKLGDLAAGLYAEFILSSKPRIPALNRWLRCADTSKFSCCPVAK